MWSGGRARPGPDDAISRTANDTYMSSGISKCDGRTHPEAQRCPSGHSVVLGASAGFDWDHVKKPLIQVTRPGGHVAMPRRWLIRSTPRSCHLK